MSSRTRQIHLKAEERDKTADEVVDDFGAALRAGDAAAAAALFSRQGCFVTPDSTAIQGRSQILEFLHQLVATARVLTIEQQTMLTAGDVAVRSEFWNVRLGDGKRAVCRSSRSTIILGRIEGVWRIAVADPWRG